MRKRLTGVAVNNSLNKTVKVRVSFVRAHPIYKKRYQIHRYILAHADETIEKGANLVIEEGRPISKNKSWRVVK